MRAGGGRAGGGMAAHGLRRSLRFGAGDHPLQRSARADDRRPGRRLREGDRDHRPRPERRRGRPGRSDRRRGARSPADVIYTENSPALEYLQSRGLLAAVDASILTDTPSGFNSPQGDWVGVSARVSVLDLQPVAHRGEPAAHLGPPARRLALPGQAGDRTGRDRLPADRHLGGAHVRPAAALHWLEGLKTNAGSHVYPDNETIADEVNRGQVALGVINQYYWYRLAARDRRCPRALALSPTSPPATPATSSTSPVRPCCGRAPIRRPPSASSPSSSRARARRSSPTRSATSTRSRRG